MLFQKLKPALIEQKCVDNATKIIHLEKSFIFKTIQNSNICEKHVQMILNAISFISQSIVTLVFMTELVLFWIFTAWPHMKSFLQNTNRIPFLSFKPGQHNNWWYILWNCWDYFFTSFLEFYYLLDCEIFFNKDQRD